MPTIAELRAATQPASIFARNSGEHWAGRLYMRRLSPYLTRLLIRTPITANGVTWLMILVGVACNSRTRLRPAPAAWNCCSCMPIWASGLAIMLVYWTNR